MGVRRTLKVQGERHHYLIAGAHYEGGDSVTQRAVDAIFQAMFLLTDLRVLMRETAPLHDLDEEQRAKASKTLEKLKKQVDTLEQELVG